MWTAVALVLTLAAAPGLALADEAHDRTPAATDVATNASALAGPLAVGATVRDGKGEVLGRITRLTTGRDGQTVVMLRKGVDSFTVPTRILHMQGAEVVSSLDREGVRALGDKGAP
jgi:hypothetical protein